MLYANLTEDSYLCCKCCRAHKKKSKIGKKHREFECTIRNWGYSCPDVEIR